jgi:signal transduction histidine kinase
MKAKAYADREQMLAKMETAQERMDANIKYLNKDIKSSQAEMRSIVDAWMTDI